MALRLLFLLPTSPLPIVSGGHQRIYQVMRRLAARHEITVLSFWRTPEARAGLDQLAAELDVHLVPVPFTRLRQNRRLPSTLARFAGALWHGLPLDVPIWDQPPMHAALQQVLAAHPIDLIQVEYPYLTGYALAHPEIPSLLMAYEVFGTFLTQISDLAEGSWARIRARRRAAAWEAYERTIYAKVNGVGAMSDFDAALIHASAPEARTFVLPNGVDTTLCTPAAIRETAQHLIFVGSPNRGPNVDAACWFLDQVWPALYEKRKDLRLTLVNLDSPQVRMRLQPGVEVTGRVPDLTPLYRSADIAIVPLLAGTGTRIKILEAFAYGLPVISTRVGYEGIAVNVGEHLLRAESPAEFHSAILSLLDNRAARARLAANGRQLVVQQYDWEVIASAHEAVYEMLIAGARRH